MRWRAATIALIGAGALMLWPALTSASVAFEVSQAQSKIAFVSRQMGVPVEGSFERFTSEVRFDESQPAAGKIVIYVETASASLGTPQIDDELKKAAWFDSVRWPHATFRSSSIRALGGELFSVEGELTMKGATRRISIPVTVSRARGHTTVRGEFTVDRSEFRVGEGIWSDTSLVGKDVVVRFSFTLVAK